MFDSWELRQIANGPLGTQQTLEAMRELTAAAQLDPITRATALSLLDRFRPATTSLGVRRILNWILGKVVLINEPVEILHRPEWMLEEIAAGRRPYGDCDDVTMLAGTLFLALGLPVRYRGVKPHGAADFVHVFAEVFFDDAWYVADVTSNRIPPVDWDSLVINV